MSFLEHLDMSLEEFTLLVDQNSSLKGACLGYAAEHHVRKLLEGNPDVESVTKMRDSDRQHRYDFLVKYRGADIRVEMKCASKDGSVNTRFHDSRFIQTEDGGVRVTDKERGLFDILGMCMFNTSGDFSFKFVREVDIPHSCNKNLPEYLRSNFLLGTIRPGTHIEVHECPFALMDSLTPEA